MVEIHPNSYVQKYFLSFIIDALAVKLYKQYLSQQLIVLNISGVAKIPDVRCLSSRFLLYHTPSVKCKLASVSTVKHYLKLKPTCLLLKYELNIN